MYSFAVLLFVHYVYEINLYILYNVIMGAVVSKWHVARKRLVLERNTGICDSETSNTYMGYI